MFCLYGICSQASRYVESFLEVAKKSLCGELGGQIGDVVLQLVTCCVAEKVFRKGKKGGQRQE